MRSINHFNLNLKLSSISITFDNNIMEQGKICKSNQIHKFENLIKKNKTSVLKLKD